MHVNRFRASGIKLKPAIFIFGVAFIWPQSKRAFFAVKLYFGSVISFHPVRPADGHFERQREILFLCFRVVQYRALYFFLGG